MLKRFDKYTFILKRRISFQMAKYKNEVNTYDSIYSEFSIFLHINPSS